MTKEITKAIILQEIQDKFKLRDFDPAKFLFDETVVPIYDIESHLLTPEVKHETVSITATNPYTFYEVPKDERWFLRAYNAIFMTGVYTIAGIMVLRTSPANYFYLDLKAAQNVSYLVNLPVEVVVNPEEKIQVNVDGYTSTGNLMLRLDVTVEKIR